uniref:G domain-containing protein n=1 Tax=Rhizophagus irregularis (strain DAOM 181602 / DAOM 197198 / MUCL 43194) TaxID=747089 RepID=U9U4D1_RHIID
MSRENLLIIGATNSGKSALANVICENEHFEENERTVRNSKDFQEYDINWKVCSKKYKLSMWDKLYESDKSKNNLEERVKSHLKSYDPLVAKIIRKLDSDI